MGSKRIWFVVFLDQRVVHVTLPCMCYSLFEVESNGRKDEIKIHYIHDDSTHLETFPTTIADDQWHRLAISFSHHFISVFVDCERVFERQVDNIDLSFIQENAVELWVAQRNQRHAKLQVSSRQTPGSTLLLRYVIRGHWLVVTDGSPPTVCITLVS